jgi:hypothetical protein
VQFRHVLEAGVYDAICPGSNYLEVSGVPAFSCKESASVSRVPVGLVVRKPRFFVDGAYSRFIHGSDVSLLTFGLAGFDHGSERVPEAGGFLLIVLSKPQRVLVFPRVGKAEASAYSPVRTGLWAMS